jgi:hypothetical protein
MTETTGAAQPARAQGLSTGDLVKQLTEQVSRLIGDELHLARMEMASKGKRAGVGAGMLGGGGVLAVYGAAAFWPPRSSRWLLSFPGGSRP